MVSSPLASDYITEEEVEGLLDELDLTRSHLESALKQIDEANSRAERAEAEVSRGRVMAESCIVKPCAHTPPPALWALRGGETCCTPPTSVLAVLQTQANVDMYLPAHGRIGPAPNPVDVFI